MSELTVGVNSTVTLWTVDEVPDSEFTFYTVGTEIVEIQSGAPGGDPGYAVGQTYPATIRVRRGTNGTTAASHLAGATLTAANAFAGGGGAGIDVTDGTTTVADVTELSVVGSTVTDEGGGVAGVAVQTRILGPFPVTYQTVDIGTAEGAVITTLPAGVLVLKALLFTTTYWEIAGSENPAHIRIEVAGVGAPETRYAITVYNEQSQNISDTFADIEGPYDAALGPVPLSIYTLEPTDVRLSISGTLVQGEGNVQIIIAEPA